MATSSEKVKCVYCNLVIIKKNLKTHTEKAHGKETKVNFVSVVSTDIRGLFGPPEKVAKSAEENSPSNTGLLLGDLGVSQRTLSSDSTPTETLGSVLSQLQSLQLKVDQLGKQNINTKIEIKVADLSTLVNNQNVHELLVACRSIDMILSFFPCFTVKEDFGQGLICTACESTLRYDFSYGMSFGSDESIPLAFSHLKESIKRHTKSATHLSNMKIKENISKQNETVYKQSKEAAINCASAAYLGYKFGLSHSFYEHCVSEISSAGGNVGLKNHSKEFSRKFLSPMYDVIKKSLISHIIDNRFPFGLIADKMTARHRKRHIIGIRVPIWDINNPNINRDIYIRHSAIGYGSGESMVDHLLTNVEMFGIPLPYIRKYMVGMAMDGQYTCLNIGSIMGKVLLKPINLSWDPMHRIELANKDASKDIDNKFIENVVNVIHETFSTFKFGNNFEVLYSEKELCDVFYTPRIFKDMKFVAYSFTVFKSFIADFKALVSSFDKIPDGQNLKTKILDAKFLLNMLFLSDVMNAMATTSKLVQISSNLPWDYFYSIDNLLVHINIMLEDLCSLETRVDTDVNNKTIAEMIEDLNKNLFSNFRSAVEIFDNSTYKGLQVKQHSARVNTRGQNDHDTSEKKKSKSGFKIWKEIFGIIAR